MEEAGRDPVVQWLLGRRPGGVVKLHHPARWRFDVLRGLDVLAAAGVHDDDRLTPALDVVLRRRHPDRRWAAQAGYPGRTHVTYGRAGQPNPWITLKALRVLRANAALLS